MAEVDESDSFTHHVWTYILVLVAFIGPYIAYRQLSLGVRTQPTLSTIGLVVFSGALVLFVGAYLVDSYTHTSARGLVVFHGLVLGLNVGGLLGEWAGFSSDSSFFVGLGGAVVFSFGLLWLYDRFS